MSEPTQKQREWQALELIEKLVDRMDAMEETFKSIRKWGYGYQGRVASLHNKVDRLEMAVFQLQEKQKTGGQS
ncbi:MAG: hypothetical protein V3T77_09155 [Planctomycetota bacterium]